MANPWDNDPVASPLDAALAAEGASQPVAAVSKSIYQQESGSGKNTTTSNAGARGGMQITPATFNSVADKGWDINNPIDNARAGVRYVAQMHEKAGGDPALTGVGYYGGPGAIDKARRGIAVSDPRNPNAPNTLQYGQQVASRIPQGNPWDNDPVVGAPQDAPQAPQDPQAPTPAPQAQQPVAAPQAVPAGTPPAPQESTWDKVMNFGSSLDPVALGQKMGDAFGNTVKGAAKQAADQPITDTVGNVARGGVAGLSLGYSDKALAKFNSLTNGTNYDDEIKIQRAKTAATGDVGKLAGDVAPFLLGGGAAGAAADLLPTASTALRTGAGMLAGGTEGAGTYLGTNDGPVDPKQLAISTGIGAVTGGIPGMTSEASNAQKAATFLRANGGAASADTPMLTKLSNYARGKGTDEQVANATRTADVVGGLDSMANRATQNGASLGASDANALAAKYTQDATAAVRKIAPADQQPLINALNQSKALSDPEIAALRTSPTGHAVADAIQMRQQAQALTSAQPASNNPLLKVGRMVVNNGGLGMLTPHSAILGAVTDLAPVRNVITNLLGGRENRTAGISALLKQSDNAAGFSAHYGPSAASQSAQALQDLAQQATGQQALQKAQQAQAATSTANLANSVQIRQQQMLARQQAAQQATQQAQTAQAAQQGASQGNLAQSVMVRQQQAQARQAQGLQAAQAAEQAQAAQRTQAAAKQAASQGNLADSVAIRQQQAQARQGQGLQAAQAAQAQGSAEQQAIAQASQAAQDRLAARVAARQQAQQGAASQVHYTGTDFNKPAVQTLLSHVDHPGMPEVQQSLATLAAQDPAMGHKIAQLLSPGAPNLSKQDFYGLQAKLQAIHGVRVPEAAATASPISDAIRSPQAWASAATSRQQVQKAALDAVKDPDVKSLIMTLASTTNGKGASPSAARQAIYNKFMASTSDPAKLVEAQRLAQPLVTYK